MPRRRKEAEEEKSVVLGEERKGGDGTLYQQGTGISLETVRRYFWSQSVTHILPEEAATELEKIITLIEKADIKTLVMEHTRIQVVVRYWRDYVKSKEAEKERKLRILEAQADSQIREQLCTANEKITESRVASLVLQRPDCQLLREERDVLQMLLLHLNSIIESLNPDILVQASLWARLDVSAHE